MGAIARAAFFDVDETLITVKSMFHFQRYWMALRGDDGSAWEAAMAQVHADAAAGVDRSEVNRAYYRRYAHVRFAELIAAGQAWYAEYRERPDAFVTASVSVLAAHQASGDTIVLVSGSFQACLEPLAADLHADIILNSEPLVADDGRLTGEVRRPMIGPAKADAVRETIKALGLSAVDCYCYGDHSSDLDMLTTVGNPAVVGGDRVLAEQARRHSWPVLPATPGPWPLDAVTPGVLRAGR